MKRYVEDRWPEEGELWVSVERCEGTLPAGYSEGQERWVNVIGYETDWQEKYITMEQAAKETIQSLVENGYGSDSNE
jgi:isoleucyl-tRNA synthetase